MPAILSRQGTLFPSFFTAFGGQQLSGQSKLQSSYQIGELSNRQVEFTNWRGVILPTLAFHMQEAQGAELSINRSK